MLRETVFRIQTNTRLEHNNKKIQKNKREIYCIKAQCIPAIAHVRNILYEKQIISDQSENRMQYLQKQNILDAARFE